MNLSPQWVGYLESFGHEATHWSNIGRPDARDSEIMKWAQEHQCVVLTNDLDFGGILALSGSSNPSVVQIRSETTLPDRVGPLVQEAIARAEPDLLSGAIMTVEIGRARVRILPFNPEN